MRSLAIVALVLLETPAAAQPAHVVWTRDAYGMTATHWIAADPAGHRYVATRPGVLIAWNGVLWEWREEPQAVPLHDCADLDRGEAAPAVAEARVIHAAVRRPGRPEQLVVGRAYEGFAADLHHGVSLVASVGPYLFVEQNLYLYGCGAHGNLAHSAMVWDLRRGAAVPPDRFVTGDLRGPAAEQLAAEAAAEEDGFDPFLHARRPRALGDDDRLVVADEVELVAVRPRYDAAALRVAYLFTADACYACGDGDSSSYTRGTEVAAPRLPALLAPYATLPPPVASFVAASTEYTFGGAGSVSGREARRAFGVSRPR
jgi:hypothetical protein